jgi:tRNA(Ile)-lysidine synthase TilS/MesJ
MHGFRFETVFFPIEEEAGGKVDCFYCALRRRTALIKLAFQDGYNRIAFGHHLDDIIETLLMNVIHHGNISTMAPHVRLFQGKISILRPLAYVEENETRQYAAQARFVPPACRCSGMDLSIRRDTKHFIAQMRQAIPDVKQNLLACLRP